MRKFTNKKLQTYVEDQRRKYVNDEEGYAHGVDYILCRVDGCPRTTPEGQVDGCIFNWKTMPSFEQNEVCGNELTIDLWVSGEEHDSEYDDE